MITLRLLALLALCTYPALAQTVGATMQGTVTDPSGAALARAAVEITHTATGAVRTLTTDETGHWREPVLQPGDYQVRITAPGFQTTLRKGINLSVGQDAVIDLKLDVGQTKTEIEVTENTEQINLV